MRKIIDKHLDITPASAEPLCRHIKDVYVHMLITKPVTATLLRYLSTDPIITQWLGSIYVSCCIEKGQRAVDNILKEYYSISLEILDKSNNVNMNNDIRTLQHISEDELMYTVGNNISLKTIHLIKVCGAL